MEKRQALKRLLQAGKSSDGVADNPTSIPNSNYKQIDSTDPAAISALHSGRWRDGERQEQTEKKSDGSQMQDVSARAGGSGRGGAGEGPGGWLERRVDASSAVTGAHAYRASEGGTGGFKPLNSAISTSSASSRSN